MNELAIKIDHVSKEYRLGTISGATLRGELQTRFAKLRGREDPNLKIGQRAHDKNERFLALDDVSLEIRKGERIGIIGHNGAGKSTLLKLICRVTAPTKGTIYMNGRVTSMLEVGTGFHGELTGRENVFLNGAVLGLSKAEIAKKYDEIVEFSEVGQFIDTPVKRYSSGMSVKLGFAVASHLDSEIMIMDEVLAVGDMAFQKKCIAKMRQAAEDEGRTILYVSHNMSTIRQLCERVIVLEHGKIIFDGDPEKAIAIYMPKQNQEAFRDVWNFDFDQKPEHFKHSEFLISSFWFTGKGGYEIQAETDLHYQIGIYARKPSQNLCFRAVLLYEDDSPIGMASTNDGALSVIPGENTFSGTIPVSDLPSGNYKLKLALYEVDGYSSEVHYDVIDGLLLFTINRPDLTNGLEWQHMWWGHRIFPELELHKLQ